MLRRFRSDAKGVAAVEFALVAPVLVVMYFGMVECSLAFLAERRADHAAAVVADLVAQPAQITTTQLDDIFNVTGPILRPFPAAPLQIRVSNVKADAQGVPKVVWSRGKNMSPLTVGSTPSAIQPGLMSAGEVKILTEVSYAYTSSIGQILPTAITFSETSRTSPRKGDVLLNP